MTKSLMGFFEAVKVCSSKAFEFKGRARRSEYWWWTLFVSILYLATSLCGKLIPDTSRVLTLLFIFVCIAAALFCGFATLAVTIRRLHDTGRSGWWYGAFLIAEVVWTIVITTGYLATAITGTGYAITSAALLGGIAKLLISTIPLLVYSIVLLVWYCQDSQPGTNKYGDNPKEINLE